jgi:hypothetical protein
MDILTLPEDIVGEIFKFIPIKYLKLTNKNNYITNYNYYNQEKMNISYYRFLIRNDSDFIFELLIQLHFNNFLKKKKITYKSKIFPRIIELLRYFTCFVFQSPKCKNIIEHNMKMRKLVFKKIRLKSNKWSN